MSGSIPPSLAATVMDLASLGKTLDILSQRFSFAARRYSNALPINIPFYNFCAIIAFWE
jgi:hypothetical protein